MGISVVTLALAKKFTKQSLIGMGALKGAPCTIKNIVKGEDSNTVTFEWKGTDDSTQTSTMIVEHGISIKKVEVDENTNELIVTLSDNTSHSGGTIKTLKGDKGDSGFSPTIVENENNNANVYKLDITTADGGTFTTPNLARGGSNVDMEDYYTKDEVAEIVQESTTIATDEEIDSLEL